MDEEEIKRLQGLDPYLKEISDHLRDPIEFRKKDVGKARVVAGRARNYVVVNGLLFYDDGTKRRLAVPEDMVEHTLRLAHNTELGGHLGV